MIEKVMRGIIVFPDDAVSTEALVEAEVAVFGKPLPEWRCDWEGCVPRPPLPYWEVRQLGGGCEEWRLHVRARLKRGASDLFLKRERRIWRNRPLPRSYIEYAEELRRLEGLTFEAEIEDSRRVLLLYPEHLKTDPSVVGISVDRDLVEILWRGGKDELEVQP